MLVKTATDVQLPEWPHGLLQAALSVLKISAGLRTLTGKIWVGPASFSSLSYINFGKIVLLSGKFQILFCGEDSQGEDWNELYQCTQSSAP